MTELPVRVTYKPALLAGSQTVEIGETHLTCSDDEGREKWRLAWPDISRAAFVEHTIRGSRLSRIDLITAKDAQKVSLSRTTYAARSMSDPDYVSFLSAVGAIATRLGEVAPDLPVTIGEYGRSRLAMFIVGALCLIGGVGIGIAALADGRGDRLMGEAMTPLALMILVGIFYSWKHAPWRASESLSAKIFAVVFAKTGAPETEPGPNPPA